VESGLPNSRGRLKAKTGVSGLALLDPCPQHMHWTLPTLKQHFIWSFGCWDVAFLRSCILDPTKFHQISILSPWRSISSPFLLQNCYLGVVEGSEHSSQVEKTPKIDWVRSIFGWAILGKVKILAQLTVSPTQALLLGIWLWNLPASPHRRQYQQLWPQEAHLCHSWFPNYNNLDFWWISDFSPYRRRNPWIGKTYPQTTIKVRVGPSSRPINVTSETLTPVLVNPKPFQNTSRFWSKMEKSPKSQCVHLPKSLSHHQLKPVLFECRAVPTGSMLV